MFEVTIKACKDLGMVKCPRCYHWEYSINYDNLCNRCVAILIKQHPTHPITLACLENIKARGLQPQDNPDWDKV